MTKKSKKYRKSHIRPIGDTLSADKENSFSNMFCCKGDFQIKPVDAASRTCPVNKKQRKNMKKEDAGQSGSRKRAGFVSLVSWKISSVSFFIPLSDQDRGYHEISPETLIDWSNLLFYRCKSTAMLSYYPNEQVRKMYYMKPTVLPELRLKCRTVSESFTKGEDGFISFKRDDSYDNSNSVKSNKRPSKKYRREISIKCEESSSKEKLDRKKKVRFADDSQLVSVHFIIAWDYAYRAARVSQWMTLARDARRFKQKIRSLEPILSDILNPQHRARIYESRISNVDS